MKAKTIEKLLNRMGSSRGIPALEDTASQILESLNNDDSNSNDIVKSIITDFTLTQKVLKLVNSAMYAPFARNVSSISDAIKILGHDALSHIVLSVSLISLLDADSDFELAKTLLASEISRTISPIDRLEEVSVASLLNNLGNLIADKYLHDDVELINNKVLKGINKDKASIEVLGLTLRDLGIEVAKIWKLPPVIVSVLDGTGDPLVVNIANFATTASSLLIEAKFEEVVKLAEELQIPDLEIDRNKLTTLIHAKKEMIHVSEDKDHHKVITIDTILNELIADLKTQPRTNLDELAGIVFGVLNVNLKTSRCLLFMRTRQGDFQVRAGIGKGLDEIRGKFKISAKIEPTAFHAAIKNNVYISIDNIHKLKESALPATYKALFPGVIKFIILPIANSSVSGLLYCDWETPFELSEHPLKAIKELCDVFLPFFPK